MNKRLIKYTSILYLLSPVIALLFSLRVKSSKFLRWSLFVFTVIYGSLFHESFLGDGKRHWERAYTYQYKELHVFWEETIAILSFNPLPSTNDDLYIHFLSYLIAGILNAPGLFFVGVAVVFAYFYSGVIVKILGYVDWKSRNNYLYVLFFVLVFLLWKPPSSMQTVRTWTGMYVLIYAVLNYHETKKNKYFLLAFTAPFFHVGFLALAIPIWMVLLTGFRNPKIYFYIFLVSMFSAELVNQTSLTETLSGTELGKSKVKAYHVDAERALKQQESLEEEAQNQTFYKEYERRKIHIYLLSGLVIFMYLILSKRQFSVIENTLFSYSLAMASLANFLSSIFAVYNRAWQIAGFLILALMLIFLSKNNLKQIKFSGFKIKLPLNIFIVLFMPYLLFQLSNMLYFSSIYLLFMPVFSWADSDMAINIRGAIGELLF